MKWRYCNRFLTDRLMLPCKATLCSLSACYIASWSRPTHNLWRHSLRGGCRTCSVQFQEKFNVGRSLQEKLGRSIIIWGSGGHLPPGCHCSLIFFCRFLIFFFIIIKWLCKWLCKFLGLGLYVQRLSQPSHRSRPIAYVLSLSQPGHRSRPICA